MSSELKLSEIFLALQGEQCYYTVPSIYKGFNIKNDINCFSLSTGEQLSQIVKFSSYVKLIEIWKAEHMYSSDSLDSVKKAMLESIITDYNAYQAETDKMRRDYTLGVRTHTIVDLYAFMWQWKNRLNYLKDLLFLLDNICGVQAMNLLFRKWTLECGINDWRYRMLDKALHAGSTAMHRLLLNWLLYAKLPALTRWFICPEKKDDPQADDESQGRSFNTSLLTTPLNDSTNTINNEPLTASNQSFVGTFASGGGCGGGLANVGGTDGGPDGLSALVLSVKLDDDMLPAPFYGCKELLSLILDIGKKVHFVNGLRRSTHFHESHRHHLETDCCAALGAQIPPDVWCTPSAIGRLATVVRQMHAVVSADMRQELMGKQRLVDHLCLVHGYFFMLRGDFASALEYIYFIKAANATSKKRDTTPFSSRKAGSQSAKIAEKCVNDALALCKPTANVADLMSFVYGERLRRDKIRGKIFSEIFMLTFGHGHCRLDQITQFSAVKEFLSFKVLRAYKRVFAFVSNLQLQRAQLDYTGRNLLCVVRQRLTTQTEFPSLLFSMLIKMQTVRAFFTRLANYAFEEVLPSESTYIFNKILAEKDPHVLLASLYPLLNGLIVAFLFSPIHSELYKIVQQCIRTASGFVGAVNKFCVLVEQSEQPNILDLLLSSSTMSAEDNGGSVMFQIWDSFIDFEDAMEKLCTDLGQLSSAPKSLRGSRYWSKLYALLFQY